MNMKIQRLLEDFDDKCSLVGYYKIPCIKMVHGIPGNFGLANWKYVFPRKSFGIPCTFLMRGTPKSRIF